MTKVNLEEIADNFSGLICFDGEGSVSIYQCDSYWFFDNSINVVSETDRPVPFREIYNNDNNVLSNFDTDSLRKDTAKTYRITNEIHKMLEGLTHHEKAVIKKKMNEWKIL